MDDVHGVGLAEQPRLRRDVEALGLLEALRVVKVGPDDEDVLEIVRVQPDVDRLRGEAPIALRHNRHAYTIAIATATAKATAIARAIARAATAVAATAMAKKTSIS